MTADNLSAPDPAMPDGDASNIVIPVAAKGHRQQFFSDPAIDKVYTMLIAMMAEVSAVRDRLDAHERLAEQGIATTPAAVDSYLPEPRAEAERNDARERYLNRIFRVLHEEAERFTKSEDPDWNSMIEQVRNDES